MKRKKLLCLVLALMFAFVVPLAAHAAAKNDCLIFTAKSDNSNLATKYGMWTISGEQYKFQAGDVIEYEVYLETGVKGIGGLDIQVSEDWSYFRSHKDYVDQNRLSGHPAANLTSKAYKKWYKRKMTVPKAMVGKTAYHWYPIVDNNAKGKTYTVRYDNIRVLDAKGKVVKEIYTNGNPAKSEKLDASGYEMSMKVATRTN